MIIDQVAAIAEKHGVPRVQIALAWLLHKEPVTAPIIGATKISHLEDGVAALSIKLTPEEVASWKNPMCLTELLVISNQDDWIRKMEPT